MNSDLNEFLDQAGSDLSDSDIIGPCARCGGPVRRDQHRMGCWFFVIVHGQATFVRGNNKPWPTQYEWRKPIHDSCWFGEWNASWEY